jgi:hypothetical protein
VAKRLGVLSRMERLVLTGLVARELLSRRGGSVRA